MTKIAFNISMSLDGYITGPDPRADAGLGTGNGPDLHSWITGARTWRERHGLAGGDDREVDIIEESYERAGAVVMGRGMFSGSRTAPWDPDDRGLWGEEPPFRMPVFVVTHHEREPLELRGGTTFTFVTEGVEAAIVRAREAAGDKDVSIAGGGEVLRGALAAGLVDELEISHVAVLTGGGTPLFTGNPATTPALEIDRVVQGPGVTHVRYRVVR